jgi:sensor histidine kinase YesM
MLLMILYSFGIYFMNRDKLFNYYAIYLVALVLYLGVRMPLLFNPLTDSFPRFMYAYNELIQVLVNITYLLFAAHFMNARVYYPKLHVAINYAVRFLGLIMVVQLILILSGRFSYLEQYLVQFERYFMIIFTVISYIYMIVYMKQRIVIFLLAGSLFFLVGAVMAMFLYQIKYMMVGAAIEVFIFSLAMGYRIKLVEQEKLKIENEINKVRLTALRAQMNPHFIFNSLNSIRAYVISSETKKASDYLTKFARLIRNILHYSSLDTITLEAELEALNLYVELEQMRHRSDFGYSVEIDPDINLRKILVPPLIFQPYVENAIVHGLTPKQGPRSLQIIIGQTSAKLLVTIRDNGVGRSYSKKIRIVNDPMHQPVAMELTSKRINLTDSSTSDSENIIITDLNNNGQPTGTEVKLQLPLQVIKHTDPGLLNTSE